MLLLLLFILLTTLCFANPDVGLGGHLGALSAEFCVALRATKAISNWSIKFVVVVLCISVCIPRLGFAHFNLYSIVIWLMVTHNSSYSLRSEIVVVQTTNLVQK
jgi:hypothetical protein